MTYEKEKKGVRVGQVRNERNKNAKKTVREERVNGAPLYTATYKVNRSDELMEFLLRKCNTSRNNVKSLLVRKQVLVNGSVVTQYNFPLAKDDEVKLSRKPVKDGRVITAKPQPKKQKAEQRPKRISVIYEDEEFIAINKPAGLLSVESDRDTECAYGYVHEYMQEKDKNARAFILHRIDKETSGVLVFAKDIKIHSMLKMHWNELVKTREYFAVVQGSPEKKEDTIVSYLKENKNNVVYSTNDPTGQKAVTHYKVLAENSEYALLWVQIDTGRKNQIRVHMQALGCPVVGDDKYGALKEGGTVKNPLGRLGLHASKLEFEHPRTKQLISLKLGQPAEFRNFFSGLQKK